MELAQTLKTHLLPSPKSCRRATIFTHKWLSVYSIGLVLSQLLLGTAFYSSTTFATETPQSMTKNIIYLTNAERHKNELSDLNENQLLDKAAQAKLDDMFKNNYWDHFSPNGKKPWDFITENGYSYTYAGENLAKGYISSDSTVNAWMNSQSHKDNILSSRYSEIGVAIGTGKIDGKPTTLAVQMFGAPQNAPLLAEKPASPDAVVLGVKEGNKISFNPRAAIPAKIPYFLIWIILFGLIVFDGGMLRRCGLHTSNKHLFEFRSALLINGLALLLLCVNFVAIA